jgi:NAD(P)-dependent dehydrogenase (short-subunit alcohol dehydrogenase family)
MAQVLRDDLLNGISVLLAGGGGELGPSLESLGARTLAFAPRLDDAGEGGAAWVKEQGPLDALVFDAGREGAGGDDELLALSAVLDAAWIACAAAANGAFIPGSQGGRIVLIAPPADAGGLAVAAADGLENLARTLSVEWARYGITVTCLAPGGASGEGDVATLVAFLLSRAGAYYSGSRFELDGLID